MIYFVSDTHLGLCSSAFDKKEKERRFVDWLSGLEDCTELFLLGDIFDYWFEYRRVIPKGYVRVFGQLAAMSDRGVKIHFFAGNHDLWLNDYFTQELGMDVCLSEKVVEIAGKRLLISHGDALSGVDTLLGRIFRSKVLKWLFQRFIHPDLSMRFGYWWSSHNRMSRTVSHEFAGEEEKIVKKARMAVSSDPDLDYIICGHTHTPAEYPLSEKTSLFVLGQWVSGDPVYARMDDGGNLSLVVYGSSR